MIDRRTELISPRAAVIMDLRDGYGSEDIAIRRSLDIGLIRCIISELRREGLLRTMCYDMEGLDK